jgi:hypothetical protein
MNEEWKANVIECERNNLMIKIIACFAFGLVRAAGFFPQVPVGWVIEQQYYLCRYLLAGLEQQNTRRKWLQLG